MNHWKKQTWACYHLKLVICQWITSKKYSTSMGRHLSPRYGQMILVSGYPVLKAVNWSQHSCAISFSSAPKLARKFESKHWFPYGADGRRTVTWLPNLLRWVDYHISLAMGLRPCARFAINKLTKFWCQILNLLCFNFSWWYLIIGFQV